MVKRKLKSALSLLLAAMMLAASAITANASGSANMNYNNTSYRMYSEWGNQSTAGLERKQVVYAYAFEGETLYFGSSVSDSQLNIKGNTNTGAATGYDIVIITPDGKYLNSEDGYSKIGDVVSGGAGYIANHTAEAAGPNIDGTNTNGYKPLSFTASKTGIYEFHFHSKTAPSGGTANPGKVAVSGTFNQKDGCIAAWDITVADASKTVKSGRTYAKYLSLNTGANAIQSYSQLYVVTDDSYIYKVSLNGIDPYGFIFFANNRGLCTLGADNKPIYHSVATDDGNMATLQSTYKVDFKSPSSPDTAMDKTYMLFFEEPSSDLNGILFAEPEQPSQITDLKFNGTIHDNYTYQGQGGSFTFNIEHGSSVTIQLNFGGDTEESTPSNTVTLSNAVVSGANTFYWDGKYDDGTYVPQGTYKFADIKVTSQSKSGEIHFPFFDVESNNEMKIERINGADGNRGMIYYNNQPMVSSKISDTDTVTASGDNYILADGTLTWKQYQGHTKYINESAGIDSSTVAQTLNFSYVKNSSQVINSGGNQAAIDVWSYYEGDKVVQKFETDSEIIVEPTPTNIGKFNGVVFYDGKNNGGTYLESEGDYGLTDIPITLTNNSDGKTYNTTTDINGVYHFTNIPYGTYTITPTINTDIYTNTTSNAPQTFSFTGSNSPTDIGYYFDSTQSKDIVVQKKWTDNVATEKNVTIKLFGRYTDGLGEEHDVDMNQSLVLSSANAWKSAFRALPTKIAGYAATYFIKEYYTRSGDLILIDQSQIVGDANNTTRVGNAGSTEYSATFTWSQISASQFLMTVTNTPPQDYKVTFHSNIEGVADTFKVFATNAESVYASEANGNYLESDKTIAEFTDIPVLPDDTSAHNNNSYIFGGWYYSDGTPLKWDKDTYLTYTDIYAKWIPVGTVDKDPSDTKITGSSTYSGFDLFGTQIRDEKYNTPTVNNSGLRFLTSYSEKLISGLEGLFTTPYTSNKKTYNDVSLKYGYVAGKTGTVQNYVTKKGLDASTFKLTLENTKTLGSTDTLCAVDSDCTKHFTSATDIDHRNYGDYRLSTLIIMYNNSTASAEAVAQAKATPVMARSYIRYTDANGIYRNAYNDYTGTRTFGGCSTTFNNVLTMVQGDPDNKLA